jgi:hypothetical protein
MKYASPPLKEVVPLSARLIREIHAGCISFFLEGVAGTGEGTFATARRLGMRGTSHYFQIT